MSKFAVRGLAESIHDELAASGVSVTLVSPGFVDSDIRRVDNHGKAHDNAPDPGARMAADAHRPGGADDRAGHPPPAPGDRRDGTRQGAGVSVRHVPWLLEFVIARFGAPKRRAIRQPTGDV